MANNPGADPSDDFLEQILGFSTYEVADNNLVGNDAASLAGAPTSMMLQLRLGDGSKSGTENNTTVDLCRATPSHRQCLRVFVGGDLRRAMNSWLFVEEFAPKIQQVIDWDAILAAVPSYEDSYIKVPKVLNKE
ncbi:unnamed protein product [Fraxinus pennsylvanica]|uniref:Uncharacterized protein n=1 Tax=Fraxinus pennsylvanica TaxID=56036 RepID=A0AAD1YZ12_9LAMI|nr:unnamed protein product [Fraxinus pennsylvanica]